MSVWSVCDATLAASRCPRDSWHDLACCDSCPIYLPQTDLKDPHRRLLARELTGACRLGSSRRSGLKPAGFHGIGPPHIHYGRALGGTQAIRIRNRPLVKSYESFRAGPGCHPPNATLLGRPLRVDPNPLEGGQGWHGSTLPAFWHWR